MQKLQTTKVLRDIIRSNAKGRVLEGGARAGKTWAIIQWILIYCQQNKGKGKRITITRDRLTWLKSTLFKDFREILENLGWWSENDWNKSEMTYMLFDNEISFIGTDEPGKLHGRKQDIFWANEAIGTPGSAYTLSKASFDQLEMRTEVGWFLDYNPKVTSHWIYNTVLTRPDVAFFHCVAKDNTFLPKSIMDKLLSYEPTAENIAKGTADRVQWLIYGLGQRAQHEGLIFTNIQYVREIPAEAKLVAYGLDFGFTNDVSALMKVCLLNGELWVQQIIYETGLTNMDLSRLFEKHGLKTSDEIIADSAEQKSIAELRAKGWNIKAVVKGKDSIQYGIDLLKKYKINITDSSMGFKQEAENYVWKEDPQTNKSMNIPVDDFNHGWDAVRYVALMKLGSVRNVTVGKTY